MIKLILASAAVLCASAAMASQTVPAGTSQTAPPASPSRQALADGAEVVCKYVVADGRARDNKPYKTCQSEEFWAAKQAADDANANHVECHYQEILGSRLRVGKRCMTASMWAEQKRMNQEYIETIQAATAGPASH